MIIPIFFSSLPTSGSRQDRDLVLSISGPRRLADAVSQLQSKFGVGISYEDVALIYAGDYARPLDTDWGRKIDERDDRFRANNRIDLAGGALDINIPVDEAGKPTVPVSQILWELIDQHKARGNPGQFQLLTSDDSFAIIPTAKRDATGNLVPEQSPLDSQISFPAAVRSGAEILKVICEAITTASGRKVGEGAAPKHLFLIVVEVGADHETARDVLVRAWRGLHWADPQLSSPLPKKMSWHLLCGPNRAMTTAPSLADVSCALNLGIVQ